VILALLGLVAAKHISGVQSVYDGPNAIDILLDPSEYRLCKVKKCSTGNVISFIS
jgi:hypothetical protein